MMIVNFVELKKRNLRGGRKKERSRKQIYSPANGKRKRRAKNGNERRKCYVSCHLFVDQKRLLQKKEREWGRGCGGKGKMKKGGDLTVGIPSKNGKRMDSDDIHGV